jgi:photosystem II stability/assembly factor-like uncharacterized protein
MSPVKPLCYALLLILGTAIVAGCNDDPIPGAGVLVENAANIVYVHNDSTESYVIDRKDETFEAITTPYAGNWIAVNGDIFNSTDGGDHWEHQLWSYNGIHAVGNNPQGITIAVGDHCQILRSTNSGFDWDSVGVRNQQNVPLRGVAIDYSNVAIAVGGNASIYKSNNSGALWDTVQVHLSDNTTLYNVCIADLSTAIIVGDEGTILRSHDGGDTWTTVAAPGATRSFMFYGIASVSGNRIMVVGDSSFNSNGGAVYLSVDGGRSWTGRSSAEFAGAHLKSVSYGYSDWWVAGSKSHAAAIWKSSDDGVTWRQLPQVLGMRDLNAIQMISDDQGFAVGEPLRN